VTFLQPLYLFGLLAGLIPIIIHLWFRKRLKKIPFSSLAFLKKTEAKKFGWLKFREIAVLVLRCLLIIFLFLSLAKPQLKNTFFKTGRLASVVLIMDNSYSMLYGNNFDQAIMTTEELISGYSPKSEFLIIPLCPAFGETPESNSWITQKSALDKVRNIRTTYNTGSIKDVLSQIPTQEAQYAVECIYIGDGQDKNFVDLSDALSHVNELFWLKIPSGSNVGITRVARDDPVSIPTDLYRLIVTVTNYASRTWRGTITIRSDRYSNEQECELRSQSEDHVEFSLPADISSGTITLYDDSLACDNTYFFSKNIPEKLNVLIVGSERFLGQALKAHSHDTAPFSILAVQNLSSVDLRRVDAIILNGVTELSPSDKIRIENFLSKPRTSIICFLGNTVGPNLREFISPCCSVDRTLTPVGYVTLDWIDNYHLQQLSPHGKTIARVTGDHPLITVTGKIAVVAAQFTPQATDIVYKASFIPLLYRLIVNTTVKSQDKEYYIGHTILTYERLKASTGEILTKGTTLETPGFYTADTETIAVNVLPSEGNLTILGDNAARALNVRPFTTADAGGNDFSDVFLYCALVALLLEILLLLLH
jgi:hypothetical protein